MRNVAVFAIVLSLLVAGPLTLMGTPGNSAKAAPRAIPTAGPTPTSFSSTGATDYASARYGYSIDWTGLPWSASGQSSSGDVEYLELIFTDVAGGTLSATLSLTAFPELVTDARRCVSGAHERNIPPFVNGAKAGRIDEPIGDSALAYGMFEFSAPASHSMDVTIDDDPFAPPSDRPITAPKRTTYYIECRTLVPGGAMMMIVFRADSSEFEYLVPVANELLDRLRMPDAVVPVPTSTPETTFLPGGDEQSASPETFTSQVYGFQLTYREPWNVYGYVVQGADETLTMTNGLSYVELSVFDDLGDDYISCRDMLLSDLLSDSEMTDDGPHLAGDGTVLDGETETGAWFFRDVTILGADNLPLALTIHVECLAMPSRGTVFLLNHFMPRDYFDAETAAVYDLLSGLSLGL